MSDFITIPRPTRYANTFLRKIDENLWEFSLLSVQDEKTVEEIEKRAEKYQDGFLQNVNYSTLDGEGLQSYIDELEKFMKMKYSKMVDLNIKWRNNPGNLRFMVQYNPKGKYRDHEKKEWVYCPIYKLFPTLQNEFSKYFCYNPNNPMHDDRYTPKKSQGRILEVKEQDLKKYIKELKAELVRD